jgi:hypothetical protein
MKQLRKATDDENYNPNLNIVLSVNNNNVITIMSLYLAINLSNWNIFGYVQKLG